jgi:hypothetical protein
MKRHRPTLSNQGRVEAIEVHIDNLSLQGFPPGDYHHIRLDVQRELEAMLMHQRVSLSQMPDRQIEQIDAGSFMVKSGCPQNSIGSQIASAVCKAIKPNKDNSH